MKSNKLTLSLIAILLTLFALNLSGCATVPIENTNVCADKGSLGATCAWTHGGPITKLTKSQWDKKRFGMACMEVPALTKLIGAIKKLCFDTGRCTYEESQEIQFHLDQLYTDLDLK